MEALSLLINIQSFTSGVFKTSGGAETTPLIDHTVPAEVLHTKDKKNNKNRKTFIKFEKGSNDEALLHAVTLRGGSMITDSDLKLK